MNAPCYNGDDDRGALSPDYDSERCQICGANEDEPCADGCDCTHCLNAAERQRENRGDGLTTEQRASVEQDAQMAAMRLKR